MLPTPLANRRCTLTWTELYLDIPMSFEYVNVPSSGATGGAGSSPPR